MRENRAYDNLQSLLIDLEYSISDIVHQVDDLHMRNPEHGIAVYYNAYVADVATRHLILSIQAVLAESAKEARSQP